MKRKRFVYLYCVLHVLLAVYSTAEVFSKLASSEPFFGPKFLLYYGCMIAVLGVYAIGWQQILKRMTLTAAFANKAVCIIWGSFWGILLFGERLSTGKAAGIVLIILGIILFETDQEASQKGKPKEGGK